MDTCSKTSFSRAPPPRIAIAPPNPFIPRHVILMHTYHPLKTKSYPNSPFYPPHSCPNSQNTLPCPNIKHTFIFPISHHFHSVQLQHFAFYCSLIIQELASSQEILEESRNKGVVTALYEALKRRDVEAIQKILAADLEWWFHGPPEHQFLMRLLTGEQESSFRFVPHSISAFGSTVLAEGFDQSRSIAWVHAWTVTDGVITQVREYFNTSLTVTRFGKTDQSDCSTSSSIVSLHCPSVWESSLPDRVGKSVPGLVLAI